MFLVYCSVGADDTTGDEKIDVDDIAVVLDVAAVSDDVTVDVDSAVDLLIWNADYLPFWNGYKI